MIYVIFNSDGSIKKKFINEYIQQGDDSSTEVFFAIDKATESEYEYNVYARLPNGVNLTVTSETDREEIIDDVKYIGCYFVLDSDVTLIEGVLQLNLTAKKDNTTKVTYNLYLTINQTDLPIDAPITITRQEYESLIESIASNQGAKLYKHTIGTTQGIIDIISAKSVAYASFEDIRTDNAKITPTNYLDIEELPSSSRNYMTYYKYLQDGPDSYALARISYDFSANTGTETYPTFLYDTITEL